MRVFLIVLLFFPFLSWADSCDKQITSVEQNLYLQIFYNGNCDGAGKISFTRKFGPNKEPDRSDLRQNAFDFQTECLLSIEQENSTSVLTCHGNGHTPLAGATYKLKQFGTYIHDCGAIGEPTKMPLMRYVCVSGCGKSAPKFLNPIDPCD